MRRLELLVVRGPLSGTCLIVTKDVLRVGRSSSNEVEIHDEELSRNHCIFEPVGETGLSVTDLASANGTYVNGVELKEGPRKLAAGDEIQIGQTTIKVIGPKDSLAANSSVDLGLGQAPGSLAKSSVPFKAPPPRRSSMGSILAASVFAIAVCCVFAFYVKPWLDARKNQPQALPEARPQLLSFTYEKVEATLEGIFRYELVCTNGELKVTADDVSLENRHLAKTCELDEKAHKMLAEVMTPELFKELDAYYQGPEPVPQALTSYSISATFDTGTKSVFVQNATEPEKFRALRERLETFSKNELGIWAMQYTKEQLIQLAEESIEVGRTKWEDRDVSVGNLYASVRAYEEARFYLETVNPKPPCNEAIEKGLAQSRAELDTRYSDRRFAANKAINLGLWDDAKRELAVLQELIPDRTDERSREAASKLIDVERRIKKGGK